jgi:hypothetical protein
MGRSDDGNNRSRGGRAAAEPPPGVGVKTVRVRRVYDPPDPGPLTLLTATRDVEHSQAAVLAERLERAR